MKKLELEFQTNADQAGLHTFKQVKREGNVAIYQRIRKDGSTHTFETFLIKIVKAGTVFAKGAPPVKEDYESYPGKSAFGRYAYSCKDMAHAERRFDELVANQKNLNTEVIDASEGDDSIEVDKTKTVESNEAAKGKRGRKAKVVKMPIPKKGEKFTMKNLMAWTGESQPLLYMRLKPLVESGLVGVAGEVREAHTRGKAQILYVSNTDDFVNDLPVEN